jgi:hypothetical protein
MISGDLGLMRIKDFKINHQTSIINNLPAGRQVKQIINSNIKVLNNLEFSI